MPKGFAEVVESHSRMELCARFNVGERHVDHWLAQIPADARERRLKFLRAKSSMASHGTARHLSPAELHAEWVRRREAREEAERLANSPAAWARLNELMAEAARQREAASAGGDPYAGLTGFERQLAIARDKGISEKPRPPERVEPRTYTGSHMAMFQ